MAAIKTTVNNASVEDFINSYADTEQKINDAFELLKIIQEYTGYQAKMWGGSIIGFGSYHYKSERSRQEGDWPMVGFSPRKSAISLYVYVGTSGQKKLLEELGKFKMGKACIYIKKLSDINVEVLKKMIGETVSHFGS